MKDALKKSLQAALKKGSIKKLNCVAAADLYIKKATIKEIELIGIISQNQTEKVAEKTLALILCDSNGDLIFDCENSQDLDDIAALFTIDILKEIQKEFMVYNGIQTNEENSDIENEKK